MPRRTAKAFHNRVLAQKVGLNKYLPVRHFGSHSQASGRRDFLIRQRKSLRAKDLKVCYEGKIGQDKIYSLLARTRRQMQMARRLLRKG